MQGEHTVKDKSSYSYDTVSQNTLQNNSGITAQWSP